MTWQMTEVFEFGSRNAEFGNKKRRQRLLISDSFDLGIGIHPISDLGLRILDFNKEKALV